MLLVYFKEHRAYSHCGCALSCGYYGAVHKETQFMYSSHISQHSMDHQQNGMFRNTIR